MDECLNCAMPLRDCYCSNNMGVSYETEPTEAYRFPVDEEGEESNSFKKPYDDEVYRQRRIQGRGKRFQKPLP